MQDTQFSKPKAYSYVRFSTPEQAQGDSFRRQTEAAERYAQENDLDLDDSLSLRDLGVSAFSGANVRKGALGQFLRAIDEGDIAEGSYLLVENLDRVSRANPWDAFPLFQQIINAGITLVTLQDGRTYTREGFQQNPMGILESLFTMIRANEESETKSRRLSAAWQQKRKDASETQKPMTKRVPAWIRLAEGGSTFELVPERVKIIKRIFREAESGKGQHQIAEGLNKDGVDTFGDGKRKAEYWHRSYIKKILSSPATYGTFVPHRVDRTNGRRVTDAETPIPNYYPRVVTKAAFDRLQKRASAGNMPRIRASKGSVSNVLAGLAKCPNCGGSMTRVNKGRKGGTPYLVCSRAKAGADCDYRIVRLTLVEAAIQHAATRQLVNDVPAGDPEIDQRIKEVDGAMTGIGDAISNVLTEIEAGRSTPAVRRRLAELESTAEELQTEWDDLQDRAQRASGRAVKRTVDRLESTLGNPKSTVTEANVALRDAFDHCVVDYNSGRLMFHWKHTTEPTRVPYDFPDS